MLADRVSNPGPLTYESGALPIALRGPANKSRDCIQTVFFDILYSTEDPRYNDSACYQRFCCKIEFAVTQKLDMTHLKHQ